MPLIEAAAPVIAPTAKPAKPEKDWLSRKEAALYLTRVGYRVSPQTLANMAANNNKGGGPPFDRAGWNSSVRYKREDLDGWAKARTQHVE